MIIWTLYTGNDLDDAGGEVWDLDALPWRSWLGRWQVTYRTFRNRSPLNRIGENLRIRIFSPPGSNVLVKTLPHGRPMLLSQTQEAWSLKSKDEVERHPNFPKLERTFSAMRDLVQARALTLHVLILPTKGDVYRWLFDRRAPNPEDERPSGFAQAVLDACRRAGMHCVDTKPYLVREARRVFEESGTLLWWRDDTHLGEEGHRAVAAFIATEVLKQSTVSRDGSPSKR